MTAGLGLTTLLIVWGQRMSKAQIKKTYQAFTAHTTLVTFDATDRFVSKLNILTLNFLKKVDSE